VTPPKLTRREQQIRTLVVDGLTNEDIAVRLKISPKTVESHLRMLFQKLAVSRREQITLDDSAPHPDDPTLVTRLREMEEQLRSYETAIRRITDRQTPLFSERVEITVTIGDTAAEDSVVERRWTTPKPYLVYRVTRPMVPPPPATPLTSDDLGVACEVVGQDVGVAVQAILDRQRRHQLLMTFQPGLEVETEWVLRYRTPGMWDPLREHGEDITVWRPGAAGGNEPATQITELGVRFVLPRSATRVDVTERRGLGLVEKKHLLDGRLMLAWRDPQLEGNLYEWMLRRS
jgi:DNA-binding CsgD family transcriptional regulator